jgi:hypothetical protein
MTSFQAHTTVNWLDGESRVGSWGKADTQPMQRPWGRMKSGILEQQRGGLCGYREREEQRMGGKEATLWKGKLRHKDSIWLRCLNRVGTRLVEGK